MKAPRWLVPFALAALLGWWISRPAGPSFVRLPGAGHPAPAWRMAHLSGTMVTSAELASNIVVLNFWATWCPPCRRELPELEAFHRRHAGQGVVLVGAATDQEGAKVVGPFSRRHDLTYPMLLAGQDIQEAFAITSLPTTVVIGRDGRVAARYLGALNQKELERAIAPLLKEAGAVTPTERRPDPPGPNPPPQEPVSAN